MIGLLSLEFGSVSKRGLDPTRIRTVAGEGGIGSFRHRLGICLCVYTKLTTPDSTINDGHGASGINRKAYYQLVRAYLLSIVHSGTVG
jgi:hypothetical protein